MTCLFAPTKNPLRRAENMFAAEVIAHVLNARGLSLSIDESNLPRTIDQTDALIAFNFSLVRFKEFADKNLTALVAVDCIPTESLFFRLTADYAKLNAAAEARFGENFTFVCLDTENDEIKALIRATFKRVLFIENFFDVCAVSGNIAVNERVLFECFSAFGREVYFDEDSLGAKFSLLVECALFASTRAKAKNHNVKY
jgi:hypothetical protein